MAHPKEVKPENVGQPKSPKQASALWKLEVQLSVNKPNDWYKSKINKDNATYLIGQLIKYKDSPTSNNEEIITLMEFWSPDFKLKPATQSAPTPIVPSEPIVKEVIKEVAKQVTVTKDMDLNTILETILPVVKGATYIKDIYDAKQPEQRKAETSKDYYKPSIFDTVLQALKTPEINVMIKGPAGSGKSLMGVELAKQLDLEFYGFNCAGSMRYGHVFGSDKLYTDPDTKQTVSKFELTALMKAFQRPCLVLLDECLTLAADILIGLNGLFEPTNRMIETKGGLVKLHPQCKVLIAANSDGRNISRNYAGAKRVDGSTLDRFTTFKIDYSRNVETNILNTLAKRHREWLETNFNNLRTKVKQNNILFDVSTRRLATCVKLIAAGMECHTAFNAALLGQLSDTELKKTGFNDHKSFNEV